MPPGKRWARRRGPTGAAGGQAVRPAWVPGGARVRGWSRCGSRSGRTRDGGGGRRRGGRAGRRCSAGTCRAGAGSQNRCSSGAGTGSSGGPNPGGGPRGSGSGACGPRVGREEEGSPHGRGAAARNGSGENATVSGECGGGNWGSTARNPRGGRKGRAAVRLPTWRCGGGNRSPQSTGARAGGWEGPRSVERGKGQGGDPYGRGPRGCVPVPRRWSCPRVACGRAETSRPSVCGLARRGATAPRKATRRRRW